MFCDVFMCRVWSNGHPYDLFDRAQCNFTWCNSCRIKKGVPPVSYWNLRCPLEKFIIMVVKVFSPLKKRLYNVCLDVRRYTSTSIISSSVSLAWGHFPNYPWPFVRVLTVHPFVSQTFVSPALSVYVFQTRKFLVSTLCRHTWVALNELCFVLRILYLVYGSASMRLRWVGSDTRQTIMCTYIMCEE